MRRSSSSDSVDTGVDTSAATTGGEAGHVAGGLITGALHLHELQKRVADDPVIEQVTQVKEMVQLRRGTEQYTRPSGFALLGTNIVGKNPAKAEDNIELNEERVQRQDETTIKPIEESGQLEVQSQAEGSRAIDNGKEYLKSYEIMVRHQDLEFDATSGYMKIIFKRIQTLGCDENFESAARISSVPSGMLTYLQMRRCLLRIGVGWNHFLPACSNSAHYGDEEVSVASLNSTSSLGTGGGSLRSEILLTDAQLIMLLTTLVEIEEKYRASKMMLPKWEENKKSSRAKVQVGVEIKGLFLAEFIQAYTLLIFGMQSLKSITATDGSSQSDVCKSLKERTLGMLRLFGPNAKELNIGFQESSDKDALKSNRSSFCGKMGRNSKPGFSNCDVKEMICSKDLALAKIMENHESEMDVVALSIEELQLEQLRQRAAWTRKRKFAKLMVAVFVAALVLGVVLINYRRRVFLASAIALEREAEANINAETIANLKEEKRALEKKLGLIEGKMRYQVNRNNDVEAQTHGIEEEKDDVDMKLLVAKAETERCFASQIEFKESLKREQMKKNEFDEELLWCQSRLGSQERELSEVQHIRVVGSTKGLATASNSNETSEGRNTLYLEMKYNKSIRNAIFFRQTYSALAGLAVSTLFQVVVPAIINLFFAPQAAIVMSIPTPVIPGRDVEMVLVDGIFGSSVAFLVVKAIATFLMPL